MERASGEKLLKWDGETHISKDIKWAQEHLPLICLTKYRLHSYKVLWVLRHCSRSNTYLSAFKRNCSQHLLNSTTLLWGRYYHWMRKQRPHSKSKAKVRLEQGLPSVWERPVGWIPCMSVTGSLICNTEQTCSWGGCENRFINDHKVLWNLLRGI